MAQRVIAVGFGINQKSNRLRCQFLHCFQHHPGVGWGRTAVNQNDTLPGQDDAGIGAASRARIDVDSLFDLFELRTQVLSPQRGSEP